MTVLGLLELQSKFKASLGKILSQNKKRKKVWEHCSVSEHLLSVFEALGTTLTLGFLCGELIWTGVL